MSNFLKNNELQGLYDRGDILANIVPILLDILAASELIRTEIITGNTYLANGIRNSNYNEGIITSTTVVIPFVNFRTQGKVLIQLTQTVASLILEGSLDGMSWKPISYINGNTGVAVTGGVAIPTATNMVVLNPAIAPPNLRLRPSAGGTSTYKIYLI